jgi:hypothetical protein
MAEARAAHKRYSEITSIRHLYRAHAYREISGMPEDPFLFGDIASQFQEVGIYGKAIEFGEHSYALHIRTNSSGDVLANAALKLAVCNFYPGEIAACRRWLDAVPQESRSADDYQRFNERVSRSEIAANALQSPVAAEPDRLARGGLPLSRRSSRTGKGPVIGCTGCRTSRRL